MDEDEPDDLHDAPLEMRIYRGAVVLTGPARVALAMTPTAADLSADRLKAAAEAARQTGRNRIR